MLDYFNHVCFQKLFAAIRKKYKSLGRVGGTVRLRGFTPEEGDALTGFLGRDCRGRSEVTIKLQEVDEILQRSRFALSLPEFLPLFFGTAVLSHKEIARRESQRWETFFAGLQESAGTENPMLVG